MKLIVSLPHNDVSLAIAATDAGADMLKVHMNVSHRASGTHFGAYSDEHEAVRAIIDAVDIPVGLMPGTGGENLPAAEELTDLARAGLEFLDIYSHHMPTWFIDLPLKLMVAFNEFKGFVEEPFYATHLWWPPDTNRTRIWMAEASYVPPEEYGTPFTYADLRRYRIFQEYCDVPIVIPTQKAITPGDALWLKRAGTGALMIGSIVTGKTAESISEATSAFRASIDQE